MKRSKKNLRKQYSTGLLFEERKSTLVCTLRMDFVCVRENSLYDKWLLRTVADAGIWLLTVVRDTIAHHLHLLPDHENRFV